MRENREGTDDERRQMYGAGPWLEEPDRVEWTHAGVPCAMVRSPLGAWCGYVGVAPGHPWHGRDYSEFDVAVHGGLTYAAPSNDRVGSGEPALWWLGFDCGHFGDYAPGLEVTIARLRIEAGLAGPSPFQRGGEYKNRRYVQAEVEQLAGQAIAADVPVRRPRG